MGYYGFDHYGGKDVRWVVYYRGGSTSVHAPSEAIALERFKAKYPDRVVLKIVKA